MQLTAVLTHAEEGGFVALNPETGTTTQGETVEEAVANLKEATALYLAEFPLATSGHPGDTFGQRCRVSHSGHFAKKPIVIFPTSCSAVSVAAPGGRSASS